MPEDEYTWVEALDEDEKDALATMVMRSLRGSWSQPQERIKILEKLCDEGLSRYEEDDILGTIELFKAQYFEGWHDGRYFRTYYQDGPEIPDLVNRAFVERFSSKLPHDLTWDYTGIEREFEGNK